MAARKVLKQLNEKFPGAITRVDVPADDRLFVYIRPEQVRDMCRFVFRDLDARYVISIGMDDRPYSGGFLVAHDFSLEKIHVLLSVIVELPAETPCVDSIANDVPGANWAEREMRDLLGIESVGCPSLKRLILPDGWPAGVHPLRKDVRWDAVPPNMDENAVYPFEEPPPGCTVVPFGPFHPTLDEPAHFRLFVEGE
ncbi:MAG: NADH-quinone oxidoreductase subunit C, partial [Vicinamibacteria bacterium]|nr:NADH-quinone oxidoreductase subunit C [Vicinamibacteria bacterium]